MAHPPQNMASDGFSLKQFGHFSLRSAPHRIQCLLSAALSKLQLAQRTEGLLQGKKRPLRASFCLIQG